MRFSNILYKRVRNKIPFNKEEYYSRIGMNVLFSIYGLGVIFNGYQFVKYVINDAI